MTGAAPEKKIYKPRRFRRFILLPVIVSGNMQYTQIHVFIGA